MQLTQAWQCERSLSSRVESAESYITEWTEATGVKLHGHNPLMQVEPMVCSSMNVMLCVRAEHKKLVNWTAIFRAESKLHGWVRLTWVHPACQLKEHGT